MDEKKFIQQLKAKEKELTRLVNRKLPVIIGRTAKDHTQDNFRKSGFVNGGIHPWQKTKRQRAGGKKADSQRGPLLSQREHLFRSISYIPDTAKVTITTTVPYANAHNQGATITIHPNVTPKMRGYAWKQHKLTKQDKWKALALTKKKKLDIRITIPKRQFIGPSQELNDKIIQIIDKELSLLWKR